MGCERRGAVVLCLAAALAVAAARPAAAEPLFAPEASSFTLADGLAVVVIPDHRAPVVTHMVWYKVGAADDPPGKSGIAHFLEHLMFKGTATRPEGRFSETVAAVGGNDNAFTTDDTTAYHQTVARQHLGLVMELEADRMVNLAITDAAVSSERQVILEERRTRLDNSPGARLSEAMDAVLFQNSHYGIPTIGWAHEMAALDRADALALYRRFYAPDNAVVVVAGDVTEAEVRALAEATYGRLPRRADPPERLRPREPEPLAARTVTHADPRVTQPSLDRRYLVPSDVTAEPGEADALSILADILGGGVTSRLHSRLVIDEAVAIDAGAGYGGSRLGDAAFAVSAVPRGEVTLAALEARIDAVIAEVIDHGVSDEEVERAKRRARAQAVYAADNPSSLARAFGRALVLGETVADVQHWLDRIAAVTAADVNKVARRYLDLRRSVTGYLVSAPEKVRS